MTVMPSPCLISPRISQVFSELDKDKSGTLNYAMLILTLLTLLTFLTSLPTYSRNGKPSYDD